MALLASYLTVSQSPCIKVAALAASTSSSAQSIGARQVFAINATQDITIRFGTSGMSTAAATNFRIPANQTATFEMSDAFTHIRVFNLGASAADIYIQTLSRA